MVVRVAVAAVARSATKDGKKHRQQNQAVANTETDHRKEGRAYGSKHHAFAEQQRDRAKQSGYTTKHDWQSHSFQRVLDLLPPGSFFGFKISKQDMHDKIDQEANWDNQHNISQHIDGESSHLKEAQ